MANKVTNFEINSNSAEAPGIKVSYADVENGNEKIKPIKLKNDAPTTFLAMNMNSLDVRKSYHRKSSFDSMAEAIDKSYKEMENKYKNEKLEAVDFLTTKTYDDNANAPSNMFLHPKIDTTSGFRQSVSGSMSIPVNKMSIKLYGSEKAVVKEQERLKDAGMWIIHPYSNFRFLWDSLTLIMLLVNIILIPVSIAFWNENHFGWIQFKVCLFKQRSKVISCLAHILNFSTYPTRGFYLILFSTFALGLCWTDLIVKLS